MQGTLLVAVAALVAAGNHHQAAAQALSTAATFGRTTACVTECPDPVVFQYNSNMVHVFDYHASAKFLSGSREPQLGVSARAHITVAGPCEMILALSHVRLADSTASNVEFAAALSKNPLRFGFQDGSVEAVCPAIEEPLWVLNFKRALLSTFQNNMKNWESTTPEVVEEVDVSGTCTSDYTAEQSEAAGSAVNITRVRATNCVPPAPHPSPRPVTALLQRLPLLDREQKCLQMISGGTLKEAICRENFRAPELLYSKDEAPVASLTSSLKLVYQFKADFVVIPNYEARRSSLAMEWENRLEDEPPTDWLDSAAEILQQLQVIIPEPELFYRLTEILRTLNYDEITEMFVKLSPELWNTAVSSFLKLGTESSMRLVLDFIRDESLPYSLLSRTVEYLMRNYEVNPAMLEIIENEVQKYGGSNLALTNVRNYCNKNPNCRDETIVQRIFEYVSNRWNEAGCGPPPESSYSSSSSPSSTPVPLEFSVGELSATADTARSNQRPVQARVIDSTGVLNTWLAIGYVNESLLPELEQCIMSPYSGDSLTALEVLRNTPCDSYDYAKLLLLAQEEKNETCNYSEIMMYRTLIRCPSAELKAYLSKRLKEEDVNQVTSFIWTDLYNKHFEWASDILEVTAMKSKYSDAALKFSRNFWKTVLIANKMFSINFDIIFSGYQLTPQYVSLKVSSMDNEPRDIFEVEIREKNNTNKYNDYVTTVCEVNVRSMGNLIYSVERNHGNSFSFISDGIYGYVLQAATEWVLEVPLNFVLRMFTGREQFPIAYHKKFDLNVQFPTSIGMPFNMRLNVTKGRHSNTALSAYAKQLDAYMLIDATHTNVGSKVVATWDTFPLFNASRVDRSYQIHVNLPEKKNKLIDFEYGVYNIENSRLTPRFSSGETDMESLCIPGLQNITGSTLCFEYCPKSKWWPIFNLKYSLVKVRDDQIRGYNLTGAIDRRNHHSLSFDVLNAPERTWSIDVNNIAQFVNIKLRTPYFSMNGSGIYRSDVLSLERSGQGVNISGLFSCMDEVAPFTLTGESTENNRTGENGINVYFYSSILETKLLTKYELGENMTFDLTLPYRVKNNKQESMRVMASLVEYNVTASKVRSNLMTRLPKNFTKSEYAASVVFSEYPTALTSLQVICENEKGLNSTDTFMGRLDVSCEGHTLSSSVSVMNHPRLMEYNCSLDYEKPTKRFSWNKTLVSDDEELRIASALTCNDSVVYQSEASYQSKGHSGISSGLSLLVPLNEPNATHPLFELSWDQNFNLFKQRFHIVCSKAYRSSWIKLNVTAGVVLEEGTDIPLGYGTSIEHQGVLELTCSKHDPFLVEGQSKISTSLEDLDLSIAVKTPFSRWDKEEAFLMKVNKKKQLLQTSLTERRKDKVPYTYTLEGDLDYDIATNVLDFTTKALEQQKLI